MSEAPAPTEIRVRSAGRELWLGFADGSTRSLTSELLRVESPSAEVQGHGTEDKQLVTGRRHVAIIGVEPVGHYAVRLQFDDLHTSGIYSWAWLDYLYRGREALWADYLHRLEQAGASRDP